MEDLSRIVVTGMGLVTPLGCGLDGPWSSLISGQSGISKISSIDVSDLPSQIAGQVPREHTGPFSEDLFVPGDYISSKDQKRMDVFIQYGLAAAILAISDSGWEPKDEASLLKTGVMVGSGIGGLPEIEKSAQIVNSGKVRRLSPFFIPASLINLVSGQIAIRYGFKGPNSAVVTACASGAHAIGDAARLIALGDAEVMIAGGAEAAICRLGVAGFSQARALSTGFNDNPTEASRPWDEDRDGFVIGEGAGVVVLETLEHAKNRGANIYAEIKGYGMSGDAYHITAPAEDGDGGFRAMQGALKSARLNPEDVDYINAHGTSTPLGDEIEHNAVKRLFKGKEKDLAMSSTKSSTGHLLGAAGAVEAIFSILAIKHQVAPPTLNLIKPSEGCDLNLIPLEAQPKTIKSVLSNSFGFGGTNASLILSKLT